MEDRVGEEFDGLIISTARYGLFVELADLFVEGLVPIDTLPGDQYAYHENVRKIIGQRTRREFSIGDRVRVILDRADPLERKLQFSIVEPAGTETQPQTADSASSRLAAELLLNPKNLRMRASNCVWFSASCKRAVSRSSLSRVMSSSVKRCASTTDISSARSAR